MSLGGFLKQINKANQYVTEKMGAAEGTKLNDDFVRMEEKTDMTAELVDQLQVATREYLQPNPTVRVKMTAVKGISKLSGQAKASTYPQPEGILGDLMLSYGKKLGEDGVFGTSLIECGDAFKQLADVKYSLDDNIKQNFLEPLHHLQSKDIKEVMHHRKKLQGRRLDFDCKKRRKDKDEDLKMAEDKFAESLHLAQMGMFNLLENDTEQISQLSAFAEGMLEYHRQCTDILQNLTERLLDQKNASASRPRKEFTPKTLDDLGVTRTKNDFNHDGNNGDRADGLLRNHSNNDVNQLLFEDLPPPYATIVQGSSGNDSPANSSWDAFGSSQPSKSPAVSPTPSPGSRGPTAQALYDFDAENPGELGFKEGDILQLVTQIDENWFEGQIRGKKGLFPTSYVQVLVPLP